MVNASGICFANGKASLQDFGVYYPESTPHGQFKCLGCNSGSKKHHVIIVYDLDGGKSDSHLESKSALKQRVDALSNIDELRSEFTTGGKLGGELLPIQKIQVHDLVDSLDDLSLTVMQRRAYEKLKTFNAGNAQLPRETDNSLDTPVVTEPTAQPTSAAAASSSATATSSSHVTDDNDVIEPPTSAAASSSSTAPIQPKAVDNEAAKKEEIIATTPLTVGIVWRGDSSNDDPEDRSGAIWDHVQFRRCFAAVGLKHITTSIITGGQDVSLEDIKKVEAGITEALQIKNPFPQDAIVDIKKVTGVIFPGSDKKADQSAISAVHRAVRTACNELKKPYLAVCAALFWLAGVNGLQLQDVHHHSHSGMVRHGVEKGKKNFKVVNNALVHVVTLQPPSGLTGTLQVNSVHTKGYTSVGDFEIFALSGDVLPGEDGTPRHLSRSKTLMEPEKDVIEAFGSKDGKVTAVQWHMEAFHDVPAHFAFFKFVFGRLLT